MVPALIKSGANVSGRRLVANFEITDQENFLLSSLQRLWKINPELLVKNLEWVVKLQPYSKSSVVKSKIYCKKIESLKYNHRKRIK